MNFASYSLSSFFQPRSARTRISVSVIAQHNTSFWCVIISDMEHWISLSDNKQGPCQHVSLTPCACIYGWPLKIYGTIVLTMHCGEHIVRGAEKLSLLCITRWGYNSIDDWSGKIAWNGDDDAILGRWPSKLACKKYHNINLSSKNNKSLDFETITIIITECCWQ